MKSQIRRKPQRIVGGGLVCKAGVHRLFEFRDLGVEETRCIGFLQDGDNLFVGILHGPQLRENLQNIGTRSIRVGKPGEAFGQLFREDLVLKIGPEGFDPGLERGIVVGKFDHLFEQDISGKIEFRFFGFLPNNLAQA